MWYLYGKQKNNNKFGLIILHITPSLYLNTAPWLHKPRKTLSNTYTSQFTILPLFYVRQIQPFGSTQHNPRPDRNPTNPNPKTRIQTSKVHQFPIFPNPNTRPGAPTLFPNPVNHPPLTRPKIQHLHRPVKHPLTLSTISTHNPKLIPHHNPLALVPLPAHRAHPGPLIAPRVISPRRPQRVLILIMPARHIHPTPPRPYREKRPLLRHVFPPPPLARSKVVNKHCRQGLVTRWVPPSHEHEAPVAAGQLAEQRQPERVIRNRFDPVPRHTLRVEQTNSIRRWASEFVVARLLLTRLNEARDSSRAAGFLAVGVELVALEEVVPVSANSERDSVRWVGQTS